MAAILRPSDCCTKISSQLLLKALRCSPTCPQDGLDDQDHNGLKFAPFRTWIVLVWRRQVDIFLRYTRVLRATNERVQFRSFEAGVHQIVHESLLTLQFIDLSLLLHRGWLFLNLTMHSKRAESLRCVYISMFRAPGKGREPKLYACLLGFIRLGSLLNPPTLHNKPLFDMLSVFLDAFFHIYVLLDVFFSPWTAQPCDCI